MGYFPTGVTVITTYDGEEPVGSTINAICSVSLDPPLLLICLDLKNPIREAFERSRIFGVNFLAHDGVGIARRFASMPLEGRFAEFAWRAAPGGAPQLEDAPVFIDCAVQDIHLGGDHLVVIGRGLQIGEGPQAPPLLYHRGAFPLLVAEA
jgi:3-hydroxy-9,10-secoandrosta-1,3,5(10)-triene-9,17-dione monooxygenase reductase component